MPNYVPDQDDIYGHDASLEVFTSPQKQQQLDQIDTAQDSSEPFDLFGFEPVFITEPEESDELDEVDILDAELQWDDKPVELYDEDSTIDAVIVEQPNFVEPLVVQRPAPIQVNNIATPSPVDAFNSWRAKRKQQQAEYAALAAQNAQLEREAHERTLRLRDTESSIRYDQYAVELSDLCQNPVLHAPTNIDGAYPLYTNEDLTYLRLPKFVNEQVSAEMQRAIQQRNRSVETVDLSRDVLLLTQEQIRASDTVRTLIGAVSSELDAQRKRSITTSINEDEREGFDISVAESTRAELQDMLLEAAKKYIINPFPEREPHKVYAFDELVKALNINEAEATVDENFSQPVVRTRMIFREGRVQVDPQIDGIGKLYNSFGSQSTYEMIGDKPDPQNITGLVLKQPTDGYAGNFMVHMRERSFGPDYSYNYEATDGSIAYTVVFDVNAIHVNAELYSQTQANINQQLATEGTWVHKAGDPLDHAKASVQVHAQITLPAQRDIVAATMIASRQANNVQRQVQLDEIRRRDEERSRSLAGLSGIGSAVLGDMLEIDRQ